MIGNALRTLVCMLCVAVTWILVNTITAVVFPFWLGRVHGWVATNITNPLSPGRYPILVYLPESMIDWVGQTGIAWLAVFIVASVSLGNLRRNTAERYPLWLIRRCGGYWVVAFIWWHCWHMYLPTWFALHGVAFKRALAGELVNVSNSSQILEFIDTFSDVASTIIVDGPMLAATIVLAISSRARPSSSEQCPKCLYDIQGLPIRHCPECGWQSTAGVGCKNSVRPKSR